MASRIGSFTATLDPFGKSRGGLGRYNISGDSISSLAQFEAYAVEVAWSNGEASDAQYLASLQKLVDLAPEGTRERTTAENRLRDAQYTIGRNVQVRAVNNATDYPTRKAALESLLAYEQQWLGGMDAQDSQAYRAQQDKVASVRGDLRQAAYADMVERANKGQFSTSKLLEAARGFMAAAQATGDPDIDEWRSTITSLEDRAKQEKLATLYQQFSQNKIDGTAIANELAGQMNGMDPSSAAYQELARAREDILTRIKSTAADKREAEVQQLRADGKMDDTAFLGYLRDAYTQADPGTSEQIRAGTRLREYTFSLAEDKLRFDVSRGKRPVADLIRFYQGYLSTMNPGSEQYRTIAGRIDALKSGSVGGGGGGGGSSSKNGSILSMPLLIDGKGALADLIGTGKSVPPGFTNLFRIDPMNTASWHWWTNNHDSMRRAFESGSKSWTYYDPKGNAYELPFNGGAAGYMSEMDATNVAYIRLGIRSAGDMRQAQTWVDRLMTATAGMQTRGHEYAVDVFNQSWESLDLQRQKALASGQLGAYYNITRAMTAFAGDLLDTSQYLTANDRDRINTQLAKIAPKQDDVTAPNYNPNGDPILNYFLDGTIRVQHGSNGEVVSAQVDPMRGYLTQTANGNTILQVVDQNDPGAYRTDPNTNKLVPTYMDGNVRVTVAAPGGGTVEVWQPILRPDQLDADNQAKGTPYGVTVYKMPSAVGVNPNTLGAQAQAGMMPTSRAVEPYATRVMVPDRAQGHQATIPLYTTFTWERRNGRLVQVRWVSTEDPASGGAVTWWKVPTDTAAQPRLVVPDNVAVNANGEWTMDGQSVKATDVLTRSRFWTAADSRRAGDEAGAPGYIFETRTSYGGVLDARPQYLIDREQTQLERSFVNDVRGRRALGIEPGPVRVQTAHDLERGYEPPPMARSRGGSWADKSPDLRPFEDPFAAREMGRNAAAALTTGTTLYGRFPLIARPKPAVPVTMPSVTTAAYQAPKVPALATPLPKLALEPSNVKVPTLTPVATPKVNPYTGFVMPPGTTSTTKTSMDTGRGVLE